MRLQKLSVRKILQRLSGTSGPEEDIRKLYKDHGYLEAYSKHTDLRVASNPHEAVGGDWEKIGKLQFEFLVSRGLRPHHRMLDIGCGTLRGGRHSSATSMLVVTPGWISLLRPLTTPASWF